MSDRFEFEPDQSVQDALGGTPPEDADAREIDRLQAENQRLKAALREINASLHHDAFSHGQGYYIDQGDLFDMTDFIQKTLESVEEGE